MAIRHSCRNGRSPPPDPLLLLSVRVKGLVPPISRAREGRGDSIRRCGTELGRKEGREGGREGGLGRQAGRAAFNEVIKSGEDDSNPCNGTWKIA